MTEFLKFAGNISISIIGFLGLFFTTKEIVVDLNFYFYLFIILFSFFASYGIYKVSEDVKLFIKHKKYKNLLLKFKYLIYHNDI